MVAIMTEILLSTTEKRHYVVETGGGSSYQDAILTILFDQVTSFE